ncbi:DUF4184 family protein [Yinghuangia seranimata]|uniref:DUF4184 family protein n=1 Tax=Yinghuangia seranimata TaxID=408067 RepID=UPI00248ADE25|nr:DUF4184 family protein [Yinghuangia seranimata]MDI2131506.1 DUF4184 family protein [Yinghuangia seranimata]
MPFTASHMAAALPMRSGTRTGVGERRGPLVASALAIGTMTPDVVLFVDLRSLPLHPDRTVTHGLVPGVLIVDLVFTAVAVGVWHFLLLRPTLALLPDALRARLAEPLTPVLPGRIAAARREGRPWVRELVGVAGWFVVSAWIGGLTHVGWDTWTHAGDAGAREVAPWLLDASPFGPAWCQVLQNISSVVGLAALAWWVRRLPARPLPHDAPRRLAVRARATVVAAVALAGTLAAIRRTSPQPDWLRGDHQALAVELTIGFGQGAALAVLLYAVGWAVHTANAARTA